MTDTIWSRHIAREDVPEDGLHVDMSADSRVRAALARTAGLRDLPRLEASFDVVRKGHEGLHVTGEVSASVVQDCVITLEPTGKNILEPIDLVFTPRVASLGNREASFGLSEGTEPPEELIGGSVDLGAIATEYFLLGIDPYPRKEGAVFEAATTGEAGGGAFAALAALKKRSKGDAD